VNQITRADQGREVVRVGVDLAKRVIQVQAVDAAGRVVTNRALPRDKFVAWCAQLPPGCMVAMEVSSSAHHWGRKLVAMGLDARIVSAQLCAPYRAEGVTGKNDANDAAAICEAAGRPHMRFVPVKSVEQQSMLAVHRLREGFKEDRTACINRIRGLLLEFGVAIPKGVRPLELLLDDVLEDACNEMNFLARIALQRAQAQWRELDAHLAWCDERIAEHAKNNDAVKQAGQLMGVGPIGASAAIATVHSR
jgi:transposase